MESSEEILRIDGLEVERSGRRILGPLDLGLRRHEILAVIGPAQSGKTTFLRCLNRTIEGDRTVSVRGRVLLGGGCIRSAHEVHDLRRRIGMVSPLPVGLPLSIFDNVAFAPRCAGVRSRCELEGRVEQALRQAALWDEVKDRLGQLGTRLSGGQQQRLALARALSHDPEILCLDEFSIAIDPVTTMRIEGILRELTGRLSVVLVTNLLAQARRVSDRTLFLLGGEMVELGTTAAVFGSAQDRRTRDYVEGRFG
jgi:phosphate transport system ATP-binding protein